MIAHQLGTFWGSHQLLCITAQAVNQMQLCSTLDQIRLFLRGRSSPPYSPLPSGKHSTKQNKPARIGKKKKEKRHIGESSNFEGALSSRHDGNSAKRGARPHQPSTHDSALYSTQATAKGLQSKQEDKTLWQRKAAATAVAAAA